MPNISDLFGDLIRETSCQEVEPVNNLVLRYIDSNSNVPLFIGLNLKTNTKYLFILLNEKLTEEIFSKFPTWNGLIIDQYNTSIEIAGLHNKWFLVLQHQHENDYKIFEAIINDICQELIGLKKHHDMFQKLIRTLERWKYFFSLNGREGLSVQAQQGIYGELQVLKELLANSSADSNTIINSWIGPERQPHDFVFSDRALEIKTFTSKKHYKVSISNEMQLDDEGINHLYLIAIRLRKVESGETLPEIIMQIMHMLCDAPFLVELFKEKLFNLGYLQEQSELYSQGYLVLDMFSFKIEPGFPRLLSNNLPQGVGDVSYTIQLSACEPFKVDFKNEVINLN
jgi:hypothetical protein